MVEWNNTGRCVNSPFFSFCYPATTGCFFGWGGGGESRGGKLIVEAYILRFKKSFEVRRRGVVSKHEASIVGYVTILEKCERRRNGKKYFWLAKMEFVVQSKLFKDAPYLQ